MSERNVPQSEEPSSSGTERFEFRLYVTGATPASGRAILNLKALCEEHLPGRYELVVVDVYQQPELAEGDRVVATPTLIRKLPLPLRRLVGDLSDSERTLLRLDIVPVPS